MPRKSRSSKGPQKAEEWQTESHARITARAKERADAHAAPSQYGFEKLATRPIEKLALGEPIAPGEKESRGTAEQTAQYAFRTSQELQMAAGSSPHRHTVTVCGRPHSRKWGHQLFRTGSGKWSAFRVSVVQIHKHWRTVFRPLLFYRGGILSHSGRADRPAWSPLEEERMSRPRHSLE